MSAAPVRKSSSFEGQMSSQSSGDCPIMKLMVGYSDILSKQNPNI